MLDQVYNRGQLLGLCLQAEYSFTDITRRQVWSARLGRERSRPRGRCRGQHQLAAAAHRWADRQLDIVLPLFAACDVCLRCRSDVDCVWRRYFGSRVFLVSWTFVRPPDIVARDTLSWFPDSHTQFVVTCGFICGPWGFLLKPRYKNPNI